MGVSLNPYHLSYCPQRQSNVNSDVMRLLHITQSRLLILKKFQQKHPYILCTFSKLKSISIRNKFCRVLVNILSFSFQHNVHFHDGVEVCSYIYFCISFTKTLYIALDFFILIYTFLHFTLS